VEANRVNPKTEKLHPKRANDLSDNEDPRTVKSTTDNAAPSRAKLLTDKEEPKCVQSRTDNENTLPKRDNPRTATEAPKRA
jgi:hypothetical protein